VLAALFTWQGLLAVVFGYLLGSVPFGLILTRAAGLGDVRKIGSGNIGATNVLRTGNKSLAAATLLLDALKGTAAVWIVHAVLKSAWGFPANWMPGARFAVSPVEAGSSEVAYWIAAFAGVAAFVGHIYPVWLGFKGGKGVATYIGAMLGFFWPGAVFFCALWLLTAVTMRYSSLAALIASLVPIAYAWMIGEQSLALLLALMAALIYYKHEANIRRLLSGSEPKIGQKK
jgi:glycerol-3-phosphate acyltransferase PlsY